MSWLATGTGHRKVKGFLIFCGLMLTIGLVWVTLAHLDARDKEYVERLVGALNFLHGTIERSRDLDADLYAPSIEPRSEPGHWVLSGIMVTRDSVAAPFSAILESICLDYVDPTCWRLEKLTVDGQAVNISELVSSNRTSTLEGGSSTLRSLRPPARQSHCNYQIVMLANALEGALPALRNSPLEGLELAQEGVCLS